MVLGFRVCARIDAGGKGGIHGMPQTDATCVSHVSTSYFRYMGSAADCAELEGQEGYVSLSEWWPSPEHCSCMCIAKKNAYFGGGFWAVLVMVGQSQPTEVLLPQTSRV